MGEALGKGWRSWWPGAEWSGGAVVLYVHGYYDSIDSAWTKHKLPAQFAAGGRNALHVVPGAPSGASEAVSWPDLGKLLEAVGYTGSGPIAVVGHSGSYRTVLKWVATKPTIRYIGLIDALYTGVSQMRGWLQHDPAARLDMVVTRYGAPRRNGEKLLSLLIPPEKARTSLTLNNDTHMGLVTGGKVIPALLQASGLPATGGTP
jgi:hypothetical protein